MTARPDGYYGNLRDLSGCELIGIDPERVVAMSREIATILGVDPQSHRGNGATRKAVNELAITNPNMRYS